MTTEKGSRLSGLQFELRNAIGGHGCMVCGGARNDEPGVAQVAEILNKYGIDPQEVEREMQTIEDNFVFAPGWKIVAASGCYRNTSDFLSACYKFLK
ncbi:MAG: hypothetical protein A2831_01495 [Candidatus Yanofskybacteria bacterium RIFCSPHIGHO2_01_FULL_44_17]|uniref:Uncharacterized protein n=1 Tax=Candidatus Yanofskybacteria bacterium RIFCSPHIGHO2_01_FULL_44_17 TaxID=1802668 RepID=A0A1F8EWZ9_9BACT|nr:MAG: hypothetical protein A2831_01495 [Candidatus Yanofskybacteria bacterium RIFCSPHIGHO2_01_FULL_44_17]